MNIKIPNRTQLLVKSDKLRKSIQVFKSTNLNDISDLDKAMIIDKIKGDGCSIITNHLGYNNFEEHQFEFALSFVWNIEFTEKLDVSSIEIIDKWGYLEEETKSILINGVKDNSHSFKYLESLFYLNNLSIDANIKQKIKNSIETILIDYFTLIVNLDNQISDFEKEKYEELKRLLQLDYSTVKEDSSNTFSSDDSLEATLKELEELVGLSDIKNEVKSLINFAKVNEIRKAKGLPTVSLSLHSVFFGPPGTGKTTIARLISKSFKSLGILKKGHLIETDRSQLVAGYVGQTAIKTKEVLDKAIDGVLFIDEAYSLSSDDDFGKEAIDTILKYMEDNRDRLIVIVAGYENEMGNFINSNPGLKSRFNKYFNFPNYSGSELLDILLRITAKNKLNMSDEAKSKLTYIINDAIFSEGKQFGNARYIRNLFEQIVQNQFMRVSQLENLEEDHLSEITISDLPN
jgi:SpoVK/Ycf46/Vps4 family AAA+-type ATPase